MSATSRMIIFRGNIVKIVEERIPMEARKSGYYYSLIHSSEDPSLPIALKDYESVVNWFGYIVMSSPLDTTDPNWMDLSKAESRTIAGGELVDQLEDLLLFMTQFDFERLHEVVEDGFRDFQDLDDVYKVGGEKCYRDGFERDLRLASRFLRGLKERKEMLK